MTGTTAIELVRYASARTEKYPRPMLNTRTPEFTAALIQASEEIGLPDYYRSSVRPLFSLPLSQWPTCCGGGCEPCAQILIAVAHRVYELCGMQPPSPDLPA